MNIELHRESDGCIVGSFWTTDYGGVLYVDTDDSGEIPHFHIRNFRSGTSGEYGFLTGIEFQKPAYFHQQDPGDILSDGKKEALCEYLNSVVEEKKFREAGITMWEMLCLMWNWNNPGNQLPQEVAMPDYRGLP